MMVIALVVASVVLASGLTSALVRQRRARRLGEERIARHEETIAKLSADLAGLQTVLQEYIGHREAAEEVLRASEERYRLLAESIDDIVSLYHLDGTAIYYSASTQKLIGFAPSELIGQDSYALVHADDRDRIAREGYMAALYGETPLVEWRCLCKDGSYV